MKYLATAILAVVAIFTTSAQQEIPPQALNYSSVIRGNNGQALPNKEVALRMSVRTGSATGSVVYQEIHYTTTSQFGAISLRIGEGSPTGGSVFSDINWGSARHYLQIELDDNRGDGFVEMGRLEFASVPYALYAGTAGQAQTVVEENDPDFNNSIAATITAEDTSKWNTFTSFDGQYSSLAGKPSINDTVAQYLNDNPVDVTETDPVFSQSLAFGLDADDTTRWNSKSDFDGDYGSLANTPNITDSISTYLTNNPVDYTETDPLYSQSPAANITTEDISTWNNSSSFDGQYSSLSGAPSISDSISNYLTLNPVVEEEIDPVFENSVAKGITESDTIRWNNNASNENCNCTSQSTIVSDHGIRLDTDSSSRVVFQRLTSDSTIDEYYINSTDWYYIAITRKGNQGAIYINGELHFESTYITTFSHNKVNIGASFFTSYRHFFDGLIDELRISNKSRTASEIRDYYNSNSVFTSDENTVALYHFDEATGSTFAGDVGASGNLYNGASWGVGKFGSALQFDGIDDRADTGFNPPDDNLTYEFWIKVPNGVKDIMCAIQGYSINNSELTLGPYVKEKTFKMQSPDGNCWKLSVDNSGNLTTMSAPCE